jgi:hypothetical protein
LIEETLKYIENLLGRKLIKDEILIVGVSYQQGYINGLKKGREENEKES